MSALPHNDEPFLRVTTDRLFLRGVPLPLPLHVADLIGLLGEPDRIASGAAPPPPGHRNNERYVYDKLGFYGIREHNSERILELTFVFRLGTGRIVLPYPPQSCFQGTIQIPGLEINSKTQALDLWKAVWNPECQAIANFAGSRVGKFPISFFTNAKSKGRMSNGEGNLHSVAIGLPHRID